MLCEDMSFYWSHRLLHSPSLYKKIHKIHHEYSTTIGLASYYSHPFEFMCSNIIPSNLGALILGTKVHIITYWMWVALRVTETVDGHCGYEFSWSPYRLIPFSGSAEYHNYHHSHNVGNFGSFFTLWDSFCKTNRWYHRHLDRKRQLEASVTKVKDEEKAN